MTETARRYFIKTWGCQMNEQDGQKMASLLEAQGMIRSSTAAGADVILLNTCSVRQKSADKLFTFLGRLRQVKDRSPGTVIGVTGCVAQQEGERVFVKAPHVDLVLGPRRIGRLPALLEPDARRDRRMDTALDDLNTIFWDGGAARRAGRRAYLTIMEGCNMGCSFCIVPTTRGREAHRDLDSVREEARRRLDEGLIEIELLGQIVNAWHNRGRFFHHLLDAVARLPGLARLRFTSSHPSYLTPDLIAVMASHAAVCPHIHLPVQSGSDPVLTSMRRGYGISGYLRRVDALRQRLPETAISTDVIVGYPGETESDHGATLDLLGRVRFSQVFAFKYSPRPGTPAYAREDDVPDAVKDARLASVFKLQDAISLEQNQALLGRTLPVLVDGPSRRDPLVAAGRTPCNRVVNLLGTDPAGVAGRILNVRITAAHPHSLGGVAAS